MKKLILAAVLLLVGLPAGAVTNPEQNGIFLDYRYDDKGELHYLKTTVKPIKDVIKKDTLDTFDDIVNGMVTDGLVTDEMWQLNFVTIINSSMDRLLYIGNLGTAITIDIPRHKVCLASIAGNGPLTSQCYEY